MLTIQSPSLSILSDPRSKSNVRHLKAAEDCALASLPNEPAGLGSLYQQKASFVCTELPQMNCDS
jgi:hypothetical protein